MPNDKKVDEWKGLVATTKPKFPWSWLAGIAGVLGLVILSKKKK